MVRPPACVFLERTMLSELNRLVETFWLVVPIALAAGCFILGGLAALILGRIGELLGYILLGSGRSALVGAGPSSSRRIQLLAPC